MGDLKRRGLSRIHPNCPGRYAPETRCRVCHADQRLASSGTIALRRTLPIKPPLKFCGTPSARSRSGSPVFPACSQILPRYSVAQDRTSMVFRPVTMSSAHGCRTLSAGVLDRRLAFRGDPIRVHEFSREPAEQVVYVCQLHRPSGYHIASSSREHTIKLSLIATTQCSRQEAIV